jgi:hypothetical protein
MIHVQITSEADPLQFTVLVKEGKTETRHQVTMSQSTYSKLTKSLVGPDRCIQAAFRFLLDREPKESILPQFDVTLISKYFPSFEKEIGGYLKP